MGVAFLLNKICNAWLLEAPGDDSKSRRNSERKGGFSDGRDLSSLVSSIGINNSFLGIFLGIFVFSLELNEKPLHFPISTNEQQMVPKIHPLPLASRADEDFLHEQTKKK